MRVLVIGDSCYDRFVYGEVSRLAPDLPIPIFDVTNVHISPGMAANVKRNFDSLGIETDFITNSNSSNIVKSRYVHRLTNYTFLRVDEGPVAENLLKVPCVEEYNFVVISDYNKGFLHEDQIAEMTSRNPNCFLDTKKVLGSWCLNAKYIKINAYEYKASQDFITKNVEDKVIHTSGKDGAFFRGTRYPVPVSHVKDSSGAGDTFTASLVFRYIQREDIIDSIKFANEMASEVVKYPGVTTI